MTDTMPVSQSEFEPSIDLPVKTATMQYVDTILNRSRLIWERGSDI